MKFAVPTGFLVHGTKVIAAETHLNCHARNVTFHLTARASVAN